MKLPVGISDFKQLIEGNYLFADKTLFIKDIIEDGSNVILITRPRRFGKTLNLSMLYYFLGANHSADENKNLFKNLNISKEIEFCNKHQHQYPTIFITFKDIKESSYKEAYAEIVELIRELYEEHTYLLKGNYLSENEKNTFNDLLEGQGNATKIKASIKQLSVFMKRKFKKAPIILIDEYDTPIQEAYLKGYYDKMILLMRSILGKALKDNKALGKAMLTGITRVAQESLFSGLNNLKVYSVLNEKFGQYFGFSEKEVSKLITECKQEIKIEPIKEWYNGYQVGQYVLYNPWSIINCLTNNGSLEPYWVNTASNKLIVQLLADAPIGVKQQFEELLQKKIIELPIADNLAFLDLEKHPGALWSLLLYAGYLKVLSRELRGSRLMAQMAIPNKEVSLVFDRIVEQWFEEAKGLESYDKFVSSLAKGDVQEFKRYLSSYIMQAGSYFDFAKKENGKEQIFHIFILGLVVGLRDRYTIRSNEESGLGRVDVLFIPKKKDDHGIILEFKISKKAEDLLNKAHEALDQIKEQQYIERFKQQNIDSVLAIGMAFYGKEIEIANEIIEVSKN